MARTSSLITISLPPTLLRESERVAEKSQMTRSEFMRVALRQYLEDVKLGEAVRVADYELASGKAKVLGRGGLVKLMAKA